MKFLHIADLHFGKTLGDVALIEEDQPYWVEKFIELVDEKKPDAVVIAGDVYDRSAPSNEAVMLLDKMLTLISDRDIPVMMVSGNHDSGQKLSFAEKMLEKSRLHIAGIIDSKIKKVKFKNIDEYGDVTFWLMPYIYPSEVSRLLGDNEIKSYDDACRRLIAAQGINFDERNVIIAHQNITVGHEEMEKGGSESMVGGVGGIEYTVFDGFEYTALGHIHKAQKVVRDNIRYAGSPLCYHFDELRYPKKGPVLVEIGEKGTEANIEICEISPLHPLKIIEGNYDNIITDEHNRALRGHYLKISVLDHKLTPDMSAEIRMIFEGREKGNRILGISGGYSFKSDSNGIDEQSLGSKTNEELFCDFFKSRTGNNPDDKEREIINFAARQSAERDENSDISSDTDKLVDFIITLCAEEEL